MNDIYEDYFDWMCSLIKDGKPNRHSYRKLLRNLFSQEFFYILPMDSNRYEDGIDLRYRFGYECDIPASMISKDIDTEPCSVLEMMIALSLRCEEHIMGNVDIGDRTGKWFWQMITCLGLIDMYDTHFDEVFVENTIMHFMNREYEKNGEGGLFMVRSNVPDMREEEIWDQLMLHLNEEIGYG